MSESEQSADGQIESEAETESLWQTVKGDFRDVRGVRLLGVFGLLAWMAFQWGWGNDILLPPIVARTFDAIDDGSTWPSAVASTSAGIAAGAAFWGLTQALDGVIVLSGLRLVPGITARISRFLRRQGWVKPFDELSVGTKFLIAYASGASLLCLVDVFATGRAGLLGRGRMLMQAVALAVAGVAIAIAVVLGVTVVGLRVPVTTAAAETIVRYASNPLTWLVIYGSLVGLSLVVSRFNGRSQGEPDT